MHHTKEDISTTTDQQPDRLLFLLQFSRDAIAAVGFMQWGVAGLLIGLSKEPATTLQTLVYITIAEGLIYLALEKAEYHRSEKSKAKSSK